MEKYGQDEGLVDDLIRRKIELGDTHFRVNPDFKDKVVETLARQNIICVVIVSAAAVVVCCRCCSRWCLLLFLSW
jgi:hypothetical protein